MKEMDKCTPYQWCLDANMRILDLSPVDNEWYHTERVEKTDFMEWLAGKTVKPNSTPRKSEAFLEYRMYGITPYNISPIQSAIQYGHAVVEYGQDVKGVELSEKIYDKWANEDKTFIILNGGTTNDNKDSKFYGSMQQHRDLLIENGILFSEFREPDLNDSLTAVVFLVDERVWNRDLYLDYVDMPYPWKDKGRGYRPKVDEMSKWESENFVNREKWVTKIGGASNDFLRTHLRTLRLSHN